MVKSARLLLETTDDEGNSTVVEQYKVKIGGESNGYDLNDPDDVEDLASAILQDLNEDD